MILSGNTSEDIIVKGFDLDDYMKTIKSSEIVTYVKRLIEVEIVALCKQPRIR
jgi:hypothetical protein